MSLESRRLGQRGTPRRRQMPAPDARLAGQKGMAWHGLLVSAWVLAVFAHARALWPLAVEDPRWPQWDMAKYGVSGLRLADSWSAGRFGELLGRIHELDVWPPLFPLVEMVAFLGFGDGFGVARGLVLVAFVATSAAAFWATRAGVLAGIAEEVPTNAVDPRRASWVALVAGIAASAALWLGPLFETFAVLVMLEVPGLLLLCCCLGSAFGLVGREVQGLEGERAWRRVWICSTLLFFCKYNYALPWLLALWLGEAVGRRTAPGFQGREAGQGWPRAFVAAVAALPVSRFGWGMLAGMGALVVLLRVSGGLALDVGGRTLGLSSAGNPAQALALLWAGAWLVREVRHARAEGSSLARRWRRRLGTAGPSVRTGVLYFGLPVGLWLLVPPHLRQLVGFLENRSAGPSPGELEFWWFYPRAFVESFAPHPAVGWIGLGLATIFVVRGLSGGPARRLTALLLLVHAGLLLAHPYKLPRFAFATAWLVWLAAVAVLVELALAAGQRLRHRSISEGVGDGRLSTAVHGVTCLVVGVALAVTGVVGPDLGAIRNELRWRSAPAETAQVAEELARLLSSPGSQASSTHEAGRTGESFLVLGTWNHLSPASLEWWQRSKSSAPAEPDWRTDYELARRRSGRLSDRLARASAIEGNEQAIATVVALALDPDAAGGPWNAGEVQLFRQETAWLDPVVERLESGALPFARQGSGTIDGSGYRYAIYRREAERLGPLESE